jgi:hypothetical protein
MVKGVINKAMPVKNVAAVWTKASLFLEK